jgi:hypothetical protein
VLFPGSAECSKCGETLVVQVPQRIEHRLLAFK